MSPFRASAGFTERWNNFELAVEDGVATLWPEIQRATLDIIGRAYGRVVTGKEVADQISKW